MKRILSLVVVGALSGGTLWAADPWKGKEYTEWSEKEIRKVLRRSPWAKAVNLQMYSGSGMGPGGGGGRPEGYSAGRGRGGGAGPGSPGGGAGGGGFGQGPPQRRSLRVLVRWWSALPIRQAYTRQQVESDKMKREEAERRIRQNPAEYVVQLSEMPKTAMAGASSENVTAATYLKIGKKQRVMLQSVEMTEGEVPDLYFVFPRSLPIELQHKDVEFVTKVGQATIKKKFKLKDMVYEGKLEL